MKKRILAVLPYVALAAAMTLPALAFDHSAGIQLAWLQFIPLLLKGASLAAGAIAGKKGVPDVAPFTPVDAQAEQNKAISGNIGSLDQVAKLSSGVTDISTNNLLSAIEKIQPGAADLRNQSTDVIKSYLEGKLPQDVIDQVRRTSAEAGVLGGYGPDSGMGKALTARDLGLNTLSLVDRGLSAAQSWLRDSYNMAPKFDFTSMFVTPGQQLETAVQNNRGLQNQQQQQANMNAQSAAQPWATLSQGLGLASTLFGSKSATPTPTPAPVSTFAANSSTFSLTPQQASIYPQVDLMSNAGFLGKP